MFKIKSLFVKKRSISLKETLIKTKRIFTKEELSLSPEEASVVTNLRMLPWKENLTRKYDI